MPGEFEGSWPFPGMVRHRRYVPFKYMQEPSVLVTSHDSQKARMASSSEASQGARMKAAFMKSEVDNLSYITTFRKQVLTREHVKPRRKQRTGTPLQNALRRIREAALHGLQSSRYTSDFRVFEGRPLEPEEFRKAMKLSFRVSLSKAELVEVVKYFDEDKDGRVSLEEVVQKMLNPSTLIVAERKTCRGGKTADTMPTWK